MIPPRHAPSKDTACLPGNRQFPFSFQRIANRLSFRTNSHTIVPFLLSKKVPTTPPPGFTLNTLAPLPEDLIAPFSPLVIDLSFKNAALPILDQSVRSKVIACLAPYYHNQLSPLALDEAVRQARQELDNGTLEKMDRDTLSRALDSHRQYGFFSQIDWCLDHWGCIGDIIDALADTFTVPTPCLEFTTLGTPPILALQRLANTFPSVRFTLHYAVHNNPTWTEVEFHPFPPFGY